MLSHKRLSCCTPGYYIHHRRLNLYKFPILKKAPYKINNLRPRNKSTPNTRITNHIQISLPVSSLSLFETRYPTRKHMKTIRQMRNLQCRHRKLPPLSLPRPSLNSNYITSPYICRNLIPICVRRIKLRFISIDLYFCLVALDIVEVKPFPRISNWVNSSRHSNCLLNKYTLLSCLFELRDQRI